MTLMELVHLGDMVGGCTGGKILHGFALMAGQAYFFFLDKKEAKNQDDNDPSARRASTRLGVLVGPALLSW